MRSYVFRATVAIALHSAAQSTDDTGPGTQHYGQSDCASAAADDTRELCCTSSPAGYCTDGLSPSQCVGDCVSTFLAYVDSCAGTATPEEAAVATLCRAQLPIIAA